MLPAAVGFAAVLLGLLYSVCLIETVDDEAPLRLLTTLPAHHSIPAYPTRLTTPYPLDHPLPA